MYPLLKSLNDEWTHLVATSVAVEPDPALHFLISRAQQGDSVAARTVLQTMLGKLVLVSVQSARRGLTQEAAFVDLTGQMWVTAAGYPLTARPRKIAANLRMDCAKQARRLWAYGQPERRPEQTYSPEAAA